MKLIGNGTTPYGRKILIAIKMLGVENEVEIIPSNPYEDTTLRNYNPVGRVPVLIDGDSVFYDSNVILHYLEEKFDTKFLMEGAKSLTILKLSALSDGILTAGINRRQNFMRHQKDNITPIDDWYMQRQQESIIKGMIEANKQIGALGMHLNLATISLLCTIGFLDFRMSDLDIYTGNNAIKAWKKAHYENDIISSTLPKG